MKNKSLTYILLIVVGIIWYQVFFRIKANFDGETTLSANINSNYPSNLKIDRDTFRIILPIRDPFYGSKNTNNFANNSISKSKPINSFLKTQTKSVKQATSWLSIQYFGMIKKNESKNPLAILKIDQELFHLRKGEEAFDGYKVVSIDKDSVLISFNNVLKIFHKKR